MKPKKIIVLVGVFAVAAGGLAVAAQLVKKEREKRQAVTPATPDPNVNPHVDPNAPKVGVQTATGYRASFDHSQPLFKKKVALRVAILHADEDAKARPSAAVTNRQFGSGGEKRTHSLRIRVPPRRPHERGHSVLVAGVRRGSVP